MKQDTQENIYNYFIKAYMMEQSTTTDVSCNAVSYDIWIDLNFGAFFHYSTGKDLLLFNKNLTQGVLSTTTMAALVTRADVLANETLLISYLSMIEVKNVTVYVKAIVLAAEKENLSEVTITTIKETLLAVELQDLKSTFSTYNTEEWTILFETYLVVLVPYFNQTLLQLLPVDISCSSYQAIVKGFTLVFTSMTQDTQENIYNYFIKAFMMEQSTTTDVSCNAVSYDIWIDLNFGAFINYLTVKDLLLFNKNLTKGVLSPTTMADLVTRADVIANETLLVSFLSKIEVENVTVFVKAIVSAAEKVRKCETGF
ncbi:uncharacterized protein LOC142098479 [Mixophyes fleayi]|uniref:uncharacterized protein LOC142098479 n=1 Tax=Mixophyes fleayi TaxID=3061075 RepID=UPI003F4E0C38